MLILRQGNSALAQKCSSFEALREKTLKGREAATACFMSTCFSTSYRVCRETKHTEQRCGAETERTAPSGWGRYDLRGWVHVGRWQLPDAVCTPS